MTESEMRELEELRRFKQQHEGKALNRAFSRLEQLLDIANHDPAMSVRAFRVMAECLICLREEIGK
jgi:hypothetical protein